MGNGEDACPRAGECAAEWRHVKEKLERIEKLLLGNGRVGLRVEVDRCTQAIASGRKWMFLLAGALIPTAATVAIMLVKSWTDP